MTPFESPAELGSHFDHLARVWSGCEYLEAKGEAEHILRLLKPLSGETGLDLACGSGQLTAELAASGSRILAADLSDRMLKVAATRFVDRMLSNVVITVQDAHHMEFTPGLFDWVVCRYGFRHFADPDAVLKEIARVTHAGSRILLSDWSAPAKELDACFKRLDAAHRQVLDEGWWKEAIARNGFKLMASRARPDRLDPLIWGELGGLGKEEALVAFAEFKAGEGAGARFMELDGHAVLIGERLELFLVR
jgi:ubiquinone/menaquinone biosynthesis C-methylase UbiE